MKLKIDNQTNYETKDLKALFRECMKQEGVDICNVKIIKTVPRSKWKKHYQKQMDERELEPEGVTESLNYNTHIHGRAWYNSYNIIMRLPEWRYGCSDDRKIIQEPIQELNKKEVTALAQIFIHEVGHNQNLRHREMADWWNFNVDYTNDFKIRMHQKKEKPKHNLQMKRYENVMVHINDKTKKIKRLNNQLKKWKLKQKYYENKLEAN